MRDKINKNEFLGRISKNTGVDPNVVKSIYNAIVSETVDVLCDNKNLSLTGFGVFSLKSHKGHPVQFEAKQDKVEDYIVMKFTASDVLISRIRENIKNNS